MITLAEASALRSPEEFAEIIEKHYEFINSGGSGGNRQTFVTSGLVFGMYLNAKGENGAQAQLQHKRFDNLDLIGVELPYANMCRILCRDQDLSGANLSGSLLTDSDFSMR